VKDSGFFFFFESSGNPQRGLSRRTSTQDNVSGMSLEARSVGSSINME
jgi:hypothetical protein